MRDVTGVIAALAVTLALAGVVPATGRAFTWEPLPPLTGAPVTFTSSSDPDVSLEWDLDGDGQFDDGQGARASTTYLIPGTYKVVLRQTKAGQQIPDEEELVVVGQLAAPFIVFPSAPHAGQEVLLVYASPTSPAVPITSYAWDLNGDGTYGEKTGAAVLQTFPAAGSYRVGLRVTDADGAFGTLVQTVNVLAPGQVGVSGNALRLLSPFPVVRITGRVTRSGTRIRRLTVGAPLGARVSIRCQGRGCPFKQINRAIKRRPSRAGRAPAAALLRVRRLERRLLRSGATLRVYVTAKGTVGKFTRFKIRSRKHPVRSDLCLVPSATAPAPCPSS